MNTATPSAILYLDNLEVIVCADRPALNELTRTAKLGLRPFITLRYLSRSSGNRPSGAERKCWHPQETHYLANV